MAAVKRAAVRIAIVPVVLLSLWIATGVTLTLTMGRTQPGLALALWPWGGTSRAYEGAILTASGTPDAAQRATARRDAARALRVEPGNVVALRVLGLVNALDGRDAAAAADIATAERFSRRDLLVEVAMIETAVARGDIDTAIDHYDRALRTGYRGYDVLFPVLIPASADPAIARALGRKLAVRPAWWNAFVERAIQHPAPNPNLAWLVRQVRLRTDKPDERAFLIAVMQKLAAQGDVDGAWRLYRDARGGGEARTLIRDGGFERNDGLPPFEWQLTDDGDIAAVREPGDASMHLRLVADQGESGVLAQQLLRLPRGRYRLALLVGDMRPGVFSLTLMCAGTPVHPTLLNIPLPDAIGAKRRIGGVVDVPAACPTQWLKITAAAADRSVEDASSPWVDDVTIERMGS